MRTWKLGFEGKNTGQGVMAAGGGKEQGHSNTTSGLFRDADEQQGRAGGGGDVRRRTRNGLAVELAIRRPMPHQHQQQHQHQHPHPHPHLVSPPSPPSPLPTVQEGSKGAGQLTPVLVAAIPLPGRAAPAPMGPWEPHWPFTRALVLARCVVGMLLRFCSMLFAPRPLLY